MAFDFVGINPNHSTILYKFVIKERMYLYYSNSGLGKTNNITNENECIVPKLYYITDN